jgi:hypothetical protein
MAFKFQQWSNEHGSMLSHTQTAYLTFIAFKQRESSSVVLLTKLQAAQTWGCGSTLVEKTGNLLGGVQTDSGAQPASYTMPKGGWWGEHLSDERWQSSRDVNLNIQSHSRG